MRVFAWSAEFFEQLDIFSYLSYSSDFLFN